MEDKQSGITRRTLLAILLVVLIVCIAVLSVLITVRDTSKSISVTTTPDCSNSAIISCGSSSTSSLKTAYNKSSYAQSIYTYFSITNSDIKNIDATAVTGTVTKNGSVYIKGNSSAVATNALIAVRAKRGDKGTIHYKGVYFSLESPAKVFSQGSQPAFVVIKNTAFDYAILADSDDPVIVSDITALSGKVPSITVQEPRSVSLTPNATNTLPKSTASVPLSSTGPSTFVTIALFAIVSVLGTVLYRLYIIRRFATK